MEDLFRMVDANVNRAAEGLRVLEDVARFGYDNRTLSEKLKKLRHGVRKNIMDCMTECLDSRDAANDVGIQVSRELKLDQKESLYQLAAANFKRAQEAIRVVEETLKLLGKYEVSKIYEECRFTSYRLEKEFNRILGIAAKRRKLDTELYCITAEEHSRGRCNTEIVEEMLAAGVKIVQYREKEKKLGLKYEECLKIREMTRAAGATFIVNDDIDIARLVKADGVHIGQEDLPIEKVRELVGEDMIIGLSTHSPAQARDAVARGADYIGVGPIYKTYTKKDVCDPVGLEYLEYVAANIDIPFVAIGGIKEHNLQEVVARGARTVALVTEVVGAESIRGKIEAVRRVMGAARGPLVD